MHTTFGDSRPAYTRARRLLLMIALVATLGFSLAPMQVALAAGADNLAAATPLTPPLSGDTTNTTSATRDAGEIGGGGGTCNFPLSGNTHSVWYKYAPAASGFLSVDTFTSNYDTVLEVFTGPASPTFATLTSIACNDDSGSTTQSALTFQATTGTNYYIVVRSYGGGAGGTLKFSASFASQHNIYVNQATGNNANPGTAARPVKTIQQGVNLAFPSGSIINIVTAGAYAESVTIGKSLTLKPTAGAVTANSFTLASGAIIALASNPISAPNVTVQAGARIPDGVTLASTSGTVSVGNGTFAQNVTIAKNLTLRAINEGLATIQPASGDAITLSGGTVTLRGFAISAAGGAGVRISGGTGPTITRNNITGSLSGVVNTTASAANGTQNFWGAASGPTHPSNPGGTGNSVSNNVSYRPWCTTPVPACNPQAGIATRLVFNPSPSDSQAAVAFPTQPVVEAQDSFGNVDTSYSGNVTLAILNNPGGGTLAGATSVAVVNGKAMFSGLSINKIGVGYTLRATSGSLTAGDSAPFDITAGPAAQLVFTTSPSDSTAGVAFPTQPVVQALDAGGNPATTFNGPVTVAITPGSGTAGATLAPPTNLTVSAVNGVATFSGLNINLAGTAYRLTASSAGLTSADSNTFNIDKMSATVTLSNLNFTYDGNPHSATATTSPPGLTVVLTYTGTTVTYGPTTTPPTNAGSYEVQADIHDPNYQGSATATLTINKATATITLSNLNVTYDGNPHSATATTSPPGLAVDFTYNGSPRAPVNAGSYAVVATIANPNYQGSANGTLVIAKASQTITFGTLANKAYGDPDFTVTATASSGLTVIFSASGNCTITGALVHITGAGSCTITASQPGDTNYNAATPVQRSFTISKGNQTITFGLLADRSIATPTFTISATASSNLTVVFSAAGQCSVSGTTVTLTALGSCTITASQPGDANWNAAAPVARTFQIVNVFRSYLPMLQFGPKPDLVGSISLTPNSLAPNSPVLIAVTVTNRGSQPASQFWVDFYINPSTPPSDTNQRWDKRCGLTPCYGIAWYVTQTVEPGQSITLTSTPDSYFAANTRWRGQFAQGTSDLYVYVDSWNPTVATGAVDELNETNNRAEYHGQPASAAIGAPLDGPVAPDTRRDEELPERPVRP